MKLHPEDLLHCRCYIDLRHMVLRASIICLDAGNVAWEDSLIQRVSVHADEIVLSSYRCDF